jgi:catechol 2,3-dioxygenase-like lactoylglutathione lyase family enzyme
MAFVMRMSPASFLPLFAGSRAPPALSNTIANTNRSVAMDFKHSAVAIVPCGDLDASQAFYGQLGFHATSIYPHHGYRILHDAKGANIHLTRVAPGSVDRERNAHGIYFYAEDVEALAAAMGCAAERKPWGLIEFAVADPDGTLVRIGWASEGAPE